MICGIRLVMIAKPRELAICTSFNRDSVLSGKSGKGTPEESRVEIKENLQAKRSALSAEEQLKLI